jgi:hypothetical protein
MGVCERGAGQGPNNYWVWNIWGPINYLHTQRDGGRGWGSPLMRGSLFHTVCRGVRWGDDIDDDGDQSPRFCTRCPPQAGPPFNMSCHLTCRCIYAWTPPPNCCGDFGIPPSCVEFVRMFLPFRKRRYMCIKKYLTMDRYFLALASWRISNIQSVWDRKHIQIVLTSTFLIIYGVCMNILITVKVKILRASKQSYSPPFSF